MNFCSSCGGKVHVAVPPMDNRPRHICNDCGQVHYQNPKVIVGTLPVFDDKVLLCQRAIEPRLGFWTLPAGFLENHETAFDGAKRETQEEAGAEFSESQLYRIYDIPRISQIYVMYLAKLSSAHVNPGEESLAAHLFDESEIPWDSLAFPIMNDILKDFFTDRQQGCFTVAEKVL
ncbi:MAG: NUDIX hydrolase [Cellvibrionales bacterium]|nr:NUDIX hydrolase [Cellvibrionales bacterium]